jgi:MerR family transcriptional regulator, copper efflux regulator
MPELLIFDLAELSGVPASTLRYYEQEGLLPTGRTPAGYRISDQAAVERLRFAGAAKPSQLSLDSIDDPFGPLGRAER